MSVNELRIQSCNDALVNADGNFVLYWMIANRRLHSNFALQHAVDRAVELGKPLLIFEALRCGYKWASDRLHRFVMQGMSDNRIVAARHNVTYFPYVEPESGAGSGLLQELADQSCVVVTDDFPCFFLPSMVKAVSRRLPVRMEAVDTNGVYPMRHTDRVFTRAFSFRNHLQKTLTPFLSDFPEVDPLGHERLKKESCSIEKVLERWPAASDETLQATPSVLSTLPIDHSVGPALLDGGESAARARLQRFVEKLLHRYGDDRNQPDDDPSSGLSPYLHFGHISTHEIFSTIAKEEQWSVDSLNDVKQTKGSREGWWGMSPSAESFLDELITWRELGYNACCHDSNYADYESLPDFAKTTLQEHATDQREYLYTMDEFQQCQTHDEIWNAAQNQLVTEGRMHNYLRMLWGKKILEWTESPQQALAVMIELNNRFAVDGRNPNSYSGIFWVLGRYDRAWGPERPVFGKIRFMSSDSTRRKLKLKGYLEKYGVASADQLF